MTSAAQKQRNAIAAAVVQAEITAASVAATTDKISALQGDEVTRTVTVAQIVASLGITASQAAGIPVWTDYTVGYASLQAAAYTKTVALFSLPAKTMVSRIVVKYNTAFSGAGFTDSGLSFAVGVAGTVDKYFNTSDITAAGAVSSTYYGTQDSSTNVPEHATAATTVNVTVVSYDATPDDPEIPEDGALLSTLTAGSLTVSVQTSVIP